MNNKIVTGFVMALLLTARLAAQSVGSLVTTGLLEPQGIAVDADNNLYITDSGHNRVVRFFPDTGVLLNFAGLIGQSGTNDGRGSLARFSGPQGVVFARGGVVVADSGNHTIRLISFDGVVSTLAGQPGLPGFADSPAGVNQARFRFPSGLSADTEGNIYVADTKNNAIRKIDVSGTVSTLAGITNGLYEPSGVTTWTNGLLLVADTRNHSIKSLAPNGKLTLLAGANSRFASGSEDALFATSATFSNPRSILWLGPESGLLVSDSGNHTLRRLFYNAEVDGWSVETFSGLAGQPGLVNGLLKDARLNSPSGLASDPLNTGFVIADLANNAVRRVQRSPIQPAVAAPKIGWVEFVFNEATGRSESKLRTVTSEVFNNDVSIAILGEAQTTTRFSTASTSTNLLSTDVPPDPTKFSPEAPPYRDGLLVAEAEPLYIRTDPIGPDVTVKSIGTHNERRSSSVVSARFQFKVANPAIQGENPAQFKISTSTVGAKLYYTTDGTDPIPELSLAPEPDGTVRLKISDKDIVFKARAFRANYFNSQVISNVFYATNYLPNLLAFGFEGSRTNRVEGSSEFIASPGQRYFAPVTLSLLPDQSVYALQFGLSVTNTPSSPALVGASLGFESMLQRSTPGTPPVFFPLPPSLATDSAGGSTNLTGLIITNPPVGFLGVGWFERFGGRVLFDSSSQDLITYSKIHETVFRKTDRRVVLGGFSFVIPTTALPGNGYQVSLSRPSATSFDSDGVSKDVFIDLPRKGSLGLGAINATKEVVVSTNGARYYVVGDLAPFYWLNSGEFGDGEIVNQDVVKVFNAVSYQINQPPQGSDFFDSMDSCCSVSQSAIRNLSVSRGPTGLALVDLNRDGILDLLTCNRVDDSLTVRLGLGNGAFGAGSRFSLGVGNFQPGNLSVSDVNGDGKLDVLCPAEFNGFVTIHSGNGDGSFSASELFAGGGGSSSAPSAVAATDMNLDGFADLIIANLQTGSVIVQTNNTTGSYAVHREIFSGTGERSGPSAMALADFNGDGLTDLVVANSFDGTLSVLTNNAAALGVPSKAYDVSVGGGVNSHPVDVALGDMNGDGLTDFVTANSTSGSVSITLRTATGALASSNYATGGGAVSVALGDFNRDGRLDVAVANSLLNSVMVLTNSGAGVLVSERSYSVGRSPSRVAVGDLDGDGKLDMAVSSLAESNVSIFVGRGDGIFDSPLVQSSEIFDGARLSDVNRIQFGDGNLDVNDLFVSFRRSLDSTLTWYRRFWSNGVRVARAEQNTSRGGSPSQPAEILNRSVGLIPPAPALSVPSSASIRVQSLQGVGGQPVVIPILLTVRGDAPMKLAALNLDVVPLDDAPPLMEQIRIFPDANLGAASFSGSQGIGNASFACLNDTVVGISGQAIMARLRVVLPPSASSRHAYRIHVTRASVSADGLNVVPLSSEDGILSLGERDLSSVGDGIPDTWRVQYFGTLDNPLGLANADADRDGVSNWLEYLAGTNPNEPASALRVRLQTVGGGILLRWSSLPGKQYVVEGSTSIVGGSWSPVSDVLSGASSDLEHRIPSANGMRFFRVRLIAR